MAQEEVERMQQLRGQTLQPRFFGSPDERTARLKQVWWQLPRYVRPVIYFFHRMFFQLGILDGRTGVIFHFLQAFWFRLVVDIKIDEILQEKKDIKPTIYNQEKNVPLKFMITFLVLFLSFYYLNILFFGITSPGNNYSPWLDANLNYISGLRHMLLVVSAQVLNWLGFDVVFNQYELLVAGRGVIKLVYSCLGLGVISFFTAFVIAYPKNWKDKLIFIIAGVLSIELLNVLRFVLLALFWHKRDNKIVDHHTIFNIIIYLIIAVALYFWVKTDDRLSKADETN